MESGGIYLSLNGPIASGKTTLGEALCKEMPKGKFFPETGHDVGGRGKKSTLGQWATNKAELTPLFQGWMFGDCYARASLASQLKELVPESFIVVDRSPKGNAVFEAVSYCDPSGSHILPSQHRLYMTFKTAIGPYGGSDFDLYLWVPPLVCWNRMCDRDNDVEVAEYNPEHFWVIERGHFASLLENMTSKEPHPQLVLDWSQDFDSAYRGIKEILTSLKEHQSKSISKVTLTKEVSYFTTHQFDPQFTAVIDASTRDLYSEEVITEVMNSLAYKDAFDGYRHLLLLTQPETNDAPYKGSFKLTFSK